MKSYEEMTTQEIAQKFLTISRQRIHQLVQKFSKRNDIRMLQMIRDAKIIARKLRKQKNLSSEISQTNP